MYKWKGCLFCDHKGKMSKEHYWGRVIPQVMGYDKIKDQRAHILSEKIGEERISTVLSYDGEQQAYTETYSVVCEACNNTWMSVEEDAFGRFFRSSLMPWPFSDVWNISRAESATVRKWAVTKALIEATKHVNGATTEHAQNIWAEKLKAIAEPLGRNHDDPKLKVYIAKASPITGFPEVDVSAVYGFGSHGGGLPHDYDEILENHRDRAELVLQTFFALNRFALLVSYNGKRPADLSIDGIVTGDVAWHEIPPGGRRLAIRGPHAPINHLEEAAVISLPGTSRKYRKQFDRAAVAERRQEIAAEKQTRRRKFSSKTSRPRKKIQ